MDTCDYFVDNTLTNFNKAERLMWEEAIKQYNKLTGKDDLSIREEAYDIYGNLVSDANALVCSNTESKTDFWDIFDNICRGRRYPDD